MFGAFNPRRWFALRSVRAQAERDGVIDLSQLNPGQVRSLFGAVGAKAISSSKLTMEFPVTNLASYAGYLKAATSKVWASWKACDLTAQVVMTVPFKVVRGTRPEPTEVKGLAQLLKYPNGTMTFAELVYLTVMHVKIAGNAYWLKSEPTLSGDRPAELIPINPRRVTIVVDRASGELTGYRVSGATGSVTIPPEEIIHFKRPHPDNPWYGLGDMEAGASALDDAINRDSWKDAFWKNGATPSGVLVLDDAPPDADAWEKLKREFAKNYQGTRNSGKVAWLSGKWSALKFGLTLAEMNDIEARKLSTEEIFTLHGVPLSVAGIRDAANYATAEIDDVRFRRYTVLPMVKMIEDTMNTDLVAGFGTGLTISFEVSGLVSVGQVVANLVPAFDRGILSINEMRVALGLAPDEENPLWDQHFISAGLVPLELAGIADQQATQDAAKEIVARFITEPIGRSNGTASPSSPIRR